MQNFKIKGLSLAVRKLLLEESFRPICHDCNAKVGEPHDENCDVARCNHCKGQRLSCSCKEDSTDIWTGYWPGTKECCEKDLMSYSTYRKQVNFDLNTYYKEIV